MDLFGRASWVMFAAGAVPAGLAGWWLGAWRARADMRRALEEAGAGLARERARLEALVERMSDALVIANLRGEVQFLNAAALPLLGAREADLLSGGKGLLRPRDPPRWRLRVQDMLKAHTSGGFVETAGAEGAPPSSYRTAVALFTDPASGDFGVLMLLRDCTAERRLDALDAARVDGGRFVLAPSAIEPLALLRRAAGAFQPAADERGVALETRLAEGAPARFSADERLVERLLRNLIANAISFAPRGGSVVVEAAAAGPDLIEFAVTDTGPGISEDQRAAVFEKLRFVVRLPLVQLS